MSISYEMDIKTIWKIVKQGGNVVIVITGISAAWILQKDAASSNWQFLLSY